ncbi:MAG: diaminopimelate epimerase, partial [Acidimicrobiales bacterium]
MSDGRLEDDAMEDRSVDDHGAREKGLRLTKHHGSGNDFLVLLESTADEGVSPLEVQALCDRHRGIGADGVIVGRPGSDGADLSMELTNADGSRAEMSGNGIRCLLQAAVLSGMVAEGEVTVDTDAGRRSVRFYVRGPGLGFGEVDMGPVLIGDDLPLDVPPLSAAGAGVVARACTVDVGNPHLVVIPGDIEPELDRIGPDLEREFDQGVNVEVIRLVGTAGHRSPDKVFNLIDMDVWERGVGITDSCGTGACAAAAAANKWGLVGTDVEVRTCGGSLDVRIETGRVILAGPAQLVGEMY